MPDTGQVGPQALSSGAVGALRLGASGELVDQLNGRYYEQVVRGNVFLARAVVTAPVIFSTAAGTGGPLIWNGTTNRNVVLLALGFGLTVVSTVAAALGITGGTGQNVAPTATTAIDSTTNCLLGGAGSNATAYRVGTPAAAGSFFLPIGDLSTGALTTTEGAWNWQWLDGLIVCPPNAWISVAASATATTTVAQIAAIWAEVPTQI